MTASQQTASRSFQTRRSMASQQQQAPPLQLCQGRVRGFCSRVVCITAPRVQPAALRSGLPHPQALCSPLLWASWRIRPEHPARCPCPQAGHDVYLGPRPRHEPGGGAQGSVRGAPGPPEHLQAGGQACCTAGTLPMKRGLASWVKRARRRARRRAEQPGSCSGSGCVVGGALPGDPQRGAAVPSTPATCPSPPPTPPLPAPRLQRPVGQLL